MYHFLYILQNHCKHHFHVDHFLILYIFQGLQDEENKQLAMLHFIDFRQVIKGL